MLQFSQATTHPQWLIEFLICINNPNHFILEWSLIQLSINLCCLKDHEYHNGRRRTSKRQSRDLPFVKLLNISVTLSPYLSVDSRQFQTSIQDRRQDYWLSLPTGPQAHLVHVYLFCMSLIYWQTHSAMWMQFIYCLSLSLSLSLNRFRYWLSGEESTVSSWTSQIQKPPTGSWREWAACTVAWAWSMWC